MNVEETSDPMSTTAVAAPPPSQLLLPKSPTPPAASNASNEVPVVAVDVPAAVQEKPLKEETLALGEIVEVGLASTVPTVSTAPVAPTAPVGLPASPPTDHAAIDTTTSSDLPVAPQDAPASISSAPQDGIQHQDDAKGDFQQQEPVQQLLDALLSNANDISLEDLPTDREELTKFLEDFLVLVNNGETETGSSVNSVNSGNASADTLPTTTAPSTDPLAGLFGQPGSGAHPSPFLGLPGFPAIPGFDPTSPDFASALTAGLAAFHQAPSGVLPFGESHSFRFRQQASNDPNAKKIEKQKVREENRERKKRWRECNQDRNKDNDLRCRVTKRANKLFGTDASKEKEQWMADEFTKRRAKREAKEKARTQEMPPYHSGVHMNDRDNSPETTPEPDNPPVVNKALLSAVEHLASIVSNTGDQPLTMIELVQLILNEPALLSMFTALVSNYSGPHGLPSASTSPEPSSSIPPSTFSALNALSQHSQSSIPAVSQPQSQPPMQLPALPQPTSAPQAQASPQLPAPLPAPSAPQTQQQQQLPSESQVSIPPQASPQTNFSSMSPPAPHSQSPQTQLSSLPQLTPEAQQLLLPQAPPRVQSPPQQDVPSQTPTIQQLPSPETLNSPQQPATSPEQHTSVSGQADAQPAPSPSTAAPTLAEPENPLTENKESKPEPQELEQTQNDPEHTVDEQSTESILDTIMAEAGEAPSLSEPTPAPADAPAEASNEAPKNEEVTMVDATTDLINNESGAEINLDGMEIDLSNFEGMDFEMIEGALELIQSGEGGDNVLGELMKMMENGGMPDMPDMNMGGVQATGMAEGLPSQAPTNPESMVLDLPDLSANESGLDSALDGEEVKKDEIVEVQQPAAAPEPAPESVVAEPKPAPEIVDLTADVPETAESNSTMGTQDASGKTEGNSGQAEANAKQGSIENPINLDDQPQPEPQQQPQTQPQEQKLETSAELQNQIQLDSIPDFTGELSAEDIKALTDGSFSQDLQMDLSEFNFSEFAADLHVPAPTPAEMDITSLAQGLDTAALDSMMEELKAAEGLGSETLNTNTTNTNTPEVQKTESEALAPVAMPAPAPEAAPVPEATPATAPAPTPANDTPAAQPASNDQTLDLGSLATEGMDIDDLAGLVDGLSAEELTEMLANGLDADEMQAFLSEAVALAGMNGSDNDKSNGQQANGFQTNNTPSTQNPAPAQNQNNFTTNPPLSQTQQQMVFQQHPPQPQHNPQNLILPHGLPQSQPHLQTPLVPPFSLGQPNGNPFGMGGLGGLGMHLPPVDSHAKNTTQQALRQLLEALESGTVGQQDGNQRKRSIESTAPMSPAKRTTMDTTPTFTGPRTTFNVPAPPPYSKTNASIKNTSAYVASFGNSAAMNQKFMLPAYRAPSVAYGYNNQPPPKPKRDESKVKAMGFPPMLAGIKRT